MLNRPKEGAKNPTMERILLSEEANPHRMAKKDGFIPKNIFLVLMLFLCSKKQVFKLHAMEKLSMTSEPIPKTDFCWKNVSSPETVAVSVWARRRTMI